MSADIDKMARRFLPAQPSAQPPERPSEGKSEYDLGHAAIGDGRWDDALAHFSRAGELGYRKGKAEHFSKYAKFFAHAGPISCNLCGGTAFKARNDRPNVLCTSCGSLERARFLKIYLERIGISSSHRVLHIAPDNGLVDWLHGICNDSYVCADISEARYSHLPNYHQMDLCSRKWPVDEQRFDLIIHSHVLEHLPCNYSAVMRRLNGLLTPDGRQLVVIPIFSGYYAEDLRPLSPTVRADNKKRFHQGNHVRLFGRVDLHKTFGALFDFSPYDDYDMRAFATEDILTSANVPSPLWQGLTLSTVFDIPRSSFHG